MTSYAFDWPEPSGRVPAPGRLRTLQQFINSYDVEDARDHLATPAAASAWFRSERLSTGEAVQDDGDLATVRDLRQGLRRLLAGTKPDSQMETALAAVHLDLGFALDGDGAVELILAQTGVAAALGAIVMIVRDAQLSGDIGRLRICDAGPCQWAYWDHSRNKSSRWCSMELCGNRQKARRHRERNAPSRGGADDSDEHRIRAGSTRRPID